MKKYKMVCLVIVHNPDASVEDFKCEIEMFNKANKGQVEVEVINVDKEE